MIGIVIDSDSSCWGWFNWFDLPYIFLFIPRNYCFFRNGSDLMRLWFFSDYINQLFKVRKLFICDFFRQGVLFAECFFSGILGSGWSAVPSSLGSENFLWTEGWFSSLDGSLIGSFVIPPFIHWKRKFLLHIHHFLKVPLGSIWDDEHVDVWCCLFWCWFMLIPCLFAIPNPHSSGFFSG